MQVTAALSRGPDSPFTLETVELDEPRADEVLVRIVATGLCHTDLFTKAALPHALGPAVLGHEGAGIVVHVGSRVNGVTPGDHVILSYRHCGDCDQCRSAGPAYCVDAHRLNSSGRRADGSATVTQNGEPVRAAFFGQSSFAEHVLATADNVVVVDKSVDLTAAAPLGCGFQTGAGAVLNVLRPVSESSVVVFGAGSVGFAALLAARSAGVATLLAVDPVPARRALAEEFGAVAIDPGSQDVVAAIRAATGWRLHPHPGHHGDPRRHRPGVVVPAGARQRGGRRPRRTRSGGEHSGSDAERQDPPRLRRGRFFGAAVHSAVAGAARGREVPV